MSPAPRRSVSPLEGYTFEDDKKTELNSEITQQRQERDLWTVNLGPNDVVTISVFNPDPSFTLDLKVYLGHYDKSAGGGSNANSSKGKLVKTVTIPVRDTDGATVFGEAVDFVRFTIAGTSAHAPSAAGEIIECHVRKYKQWQARSLGGGTVPRLGE